MTDQTHRDEQIDRMRGKTLALRASLRTTKPEYFEGSDSIEAEIEAIAELESALKALD